MNYPFIQVLIIGLLLICFIIGSSIYCIVYDSNDNEKIENQEDIERNNAEIVWSWVSLMSCIVIIVVLGILCIIDKKVKSLEMFKTIRNYNLNKMFCFLNLYKKRFVFSIIIQDV